MLKDRIIELYRAGMPYKCIASRLRITVSYASNTVSRSAMCDRRTKFDRCRAKFLKLYLRRHYTAAVRTELGISHATYRAWRMRLGLPGLSKTDAARVGARAMLEQHLAGPSEIRCDAERTANHAAGLPAVTNCEREILVVIQSLGGTATAAEVSDATGRGLRTAGIHLRRLAESEVLVRSKGTHNTYLFTMTPFVAHQVKEATNA
jgi:hypothetical protein